MIKKMNVSKGRVTSAGEGQTPVPGLTRPASPVMSKTRVIKAPSIPRKNEPPKTAAGRMGLNMSGTRVTSKETKKR